MKIKAVKITDGITPVLSCQSKISQIKLTAPRPLSDVELQDIFRTISDQQITVQLITVHAAQLVFSVPSTMTGAIVDQFCQDYHIKAVDCAQISISGVQSNHVSEITAKIINTLSSMNVSILHLTTSQAWVSVLIEQPHLARARSAIRAAL